MAGTVGGPLYVSGNGVARCAVAAVGSAKSRASATGVLAGDIEQLRECGRALATSVGKRTAARMYRI
jgi:hypothetical protein